MDKQGSPTYFSLSCLLGSGKKYFLGLATIQIIVVWFIYNKNNDLLSFVSDYSSPQPKRAFNYSVYNSSIFHLPLTQQEGMLPFYIEVGLNIWCFKNGVDIKSSKANKQCKCISRWYGLDCGIPEAVWSSTFLQEGRKQDVEIRRRKRPRRIISSILFQSEFDLLELRVQEMFSVVDAFLIAEEEKIRPSVLLNELQSGYLAEFQNKIMHIFVKNVEHNQIKEVEWIIFMFHTLWIEGWKRLADFRPDDIFIFSHVSAIISKDILIFLRLYDGYPEPLFFKLRPLVFQFRRHVTDNDILKNKLMTFIPTGCTFQYLHLLCNYDVLKFLTNSCSGSKHVKEKFETNNWKLESWTIGTELSPSGWHCNLCCRSHEIKSIILNNMWLVRNINISVIMPDLNSNSTSAIDKLVKEGKWFDGTYIQLNILPKSDPFFAPLTVMNNPHRYLYLIDDN